VTHRADPTFFAWTNGADLIDAYLAALSALFEPTRVGEDPWEKRVDVSTWGYRAEMPRTGVSLQELLDLVSAHLKRESRARAHIPVRMPSQDWVANVAVTCSVPERRRGVPPGCVFTAESGYTHLLPTTVGVAASYANLPVEAGAAMVSRLGQQDMECLLVRLCAPDAHPRVKTGGYTMLNKLYETMAFGIDLWIDPLEMAASYNGDLHVARDVALSWLYLYEGECVEDVAGLSLDVLATRVEAAPTGATVGLAPAPKYVIEHLSKDTRFDHRGARGKPPGAMVVEARKRIPQDDELSREQVLAILQTPPETLLDALDAAAVPDEDWRDAEKLALEAIEAKKQGEPTDWVHVDTYNHRRFIEQHAPYHIRRLENGGVMIATHPYRHLWPLWADALALLGIRP
jgi:hypothetical protein